MESLKKGNIKLAGICTYIHTHIRTHTYVPVFAETHTGLEVDPSPSARYSLLLISALPLSLPYLVGQWRFEVNLLNLFLFQLVRLFLILIRTFFCPTGESMRKKSRNKLCNNMVLN